jgi:uncharacterized protein (TIGR00369 family)
MPEKNMIDQRQITFRFLAEPADINFGGKVHGGAVMKWIDQAGYACAVAWSGNYCVTINVAGIRFYRPIRVGNMVQLKSKVVYTGKSSMAVAVDVAAANPKTGRYSTTTHCIITFVAVDEDGFSVEVPKWTPLTDQDKELEAYAIKLKNNSSEMETEFSQILSGN